MENKLDPEFKAKWIEALRSGEYKQTRFCMVSQDGDSFCCLGVARAVQIGRKFKREETDYQSLPSPLNEEGSDSPKHNLIYMNDHHRKSFSEIADYIEQNL